MSRIHHASHTLCMSVLCLLLFLLLFLSLSLSLSLSLFLPRLLPVVVYIASSSTGLRVDQFSIVFPCGRLCSIFPKRLAYARFNPIVVPLLRPRHTELLFFFFSLRLIPRSSVPERSRRIIAPRVPFRIPLEREVPNFSPPSIARRVVDSLLRNKRYRHRQMVDKMHPKCPMSVSHSLPALLFLALHP